ncbi:MAG TPA: hypothetical protein VGK32_05570 [Vicinamibacterales bacterium]
MNSAHLLLVLCCIGLPALRAHHAAAPPTGGQASEGDVFAILRTIDQADTRQAWPGFRLSDWPLAVFDGKQTFLLRHPSPPVEFTPLVGRPGVFVAAGRYPAVVGNSTVYIGGVRTATVIATPGPAPDSTLLAYVEEVFHVFWLRRHTNFRPNEMARYAYPVKDDRNLRRVLGEDEALSRALEAASARQAAAWVALALQLRHERNAWLTDDDRAFETGLEMMEGTANCVARVVVGEKPGATAARLRTERPADQIRWRYYDSGAAVCLLLERLQPDWKDRIDAEPDQTTVGLLEAAATRSGARPAAFSAAELSRFEVHAATAIAELSARQGRLREEIQGRAGPRIVVEIASGVEPLRVTRFDPINLLVLDAGEVAHPRYLTLSGADGVIEVTNPGYERGSFAGTVVLTRPAGRHPLGEGIRMASIVGLRTAPTVERREGRLTLETEGVRITLRDAEVRTEGETLRIVVSPRR